MGYVAYVVLMQNNNSRLGSVAKVVMLMQNNDSRVGSVAKVVNSMKIMILVWVL